MAAIRIDQPRRPSQQRLLEALQYPDRGNTTMPSVVHEQARGVVRDVMVTNLDPDAFVAVELTLYLLRGEPKRFLIPDVLVTLEAGQLDQATGDLRKAYRIWDEGPPDVVIELASPSTVVRDNVGKKEDYAAFGVREYVQFDPLGPDDPEGPLLVPKLQVWRLVAGGYVAVVAAAGCGIPSAVLPGLEWVQAGQLLRLREVVTGALLPTAAEQEAARADAEAARADAEAARADAEENERRRAEVGRQLAEVAQRRAEARADAADAELARLRAEIARMRGGEASPGS